MMWKVIFNLGKTTAQGEQIIDQVIIESGFKNKGQAEAWPADGAKQRYGPVFWARIRSIEVSEEVT